MLKREQEFVCDPVKHKRQAAAHAAEREAMLDRHRAKQAEEEARTLAKARAIVDAAERKAAGGAEGLQIPVSGPSNDDVEVDEDADFGDDATDAG